MTRVEIMLVAVLIAIGILLGIIFGGGTIWFLKPGGDTMVVDKVVQKYVCADGTVKDRLSECPVIEGGNGSTRVVCPPCECDDVTVNPYRRCDCVQCLASCGFGGANVTTTTLYVPTCEACTSDEDCGAAHYENVTRCRSIQGTEKMYRNYIQPFCDDGCCKVTQTQNVIRSCTDDERCISDEGCVMYEETDDEE